MVDWVWRFRGWALVGVGCDLAWLVKEVGCDLAGLDEEESRRVSRDQGLRTWRFSFSGIKMTYCRSSSGVDRASSSDAWRSRTRSINSDYLPWCQMAPQSCLPDLVNLSKGMGLTKQQLWLTNEVYVVDWVWWFRGWAFVGVGGDVAGLVEEESGHVGREHGSVDHKEQDHPVPKSLKDNRRKLKTPLKHYSPIEKEKT